MDADQDDGFLVRDKAWTQTRNLSVFPSTFKKSVKHQNKIWLYLDTHLDKLLEGIFI